MKNLELVSVILLAGALSIDAFGVGIAYGIKKIKITWINILVISLSTTCAITLSILLGKYLQYFLSYQVEKIISSVILMSIGLLQIIKGWKEKRCKQLLKKNEQQRSIKNLAFRVRALGIILNIMDNPTKADLDSSKNISFFESLLLGLALNVDALGVGLSVGIIGNSFLLVPLATITLIIAIKLGLFISKRFLSKFSEDYGYLFTGLILFIIGINRIL